MNSLELIFSMLGEASTTMIARGRDAQGFDPNKVAAIDGGSVAGGARKDLEQKSGERVISRKNFIKTPQNKKLLKKSRGQGRSPNSESKFMTNQLPTTAAMLNSHDPHP